MKKSFQTSSQRHLRRKAARAEKRRTVKAAVRVRQFSQGSVPWDADKDNCRFILAAESERLEPTDSSPLDALDPRFRSSAGWKEVGPNAAQGADVTISMQRPVPEIATGGDFRFVAFDGEAYRGRAKDDQALFQELWDHQLNGRPFSMPFIKSGPVIWRKLGIEMPPESTAYMLSLKCVDAET